MPTEIPDPWGDDIDVDVVSPLVILKTQAEAIARRTKGLLTAEVNTSAQPDETFSFISTHKLLILARSIGYEGEELLQIQHPEERYYPLSIEVPTAIVWDYSDSDTPSCYRGCNDQDELLAALRTVLSSPPTKATLNNLLARVNEKREQQK